MENKKTVLILVVFALVGILIFFLPDIYKFMNTKKVTDDIKDIKKEKEEVVEPLTLDSDAVKNLKYPIMRYSVNTPKSYYQNSTFKISDLSNNEILVNALADTYDGNMNNYSGYTGNCTDRKKELKTTYLKSRIRNILGNELKFEYTDFSVNEMQDYSDYVGEWKYNSSSDSYIYYGQCNTSSDGTKYYDLRNVYKIETQDENYTIILYSYIGFAKVSNGNYIIYSDSNYNNKISEGAFTDYDSLNNSFKNLAEKTNITYKYIFKKGICTYGDYCLSESAWINE